MNNTAIDLILVCSAAVVILAVVDLVKRRFHLAVLQLLGLTLVFLGLNRGIDFPHWRIAFGGGSDETLGFFTIGAYFLCMVLGIVSNYFYFRDAPFSWDGLLRPIFVSPIVFLPLLGTLPPPSEGLHVLQAASLGLLAFQNGFFWKVVFERAAKKQNTN
jgi:hypothetical protein